MIPRTTPGVLAALAPESSKRRALEEVGAASLLWVPLTARGHVLGILALGHADEGEPFDLRDLVLAEELARRAAIALDNARLYSASQAAIQARDEVLSVVSHDLRNPLGTVAMSSDLLLEVDLPPEERRRHLQIIRRSARTMERLICDLLDVSQADRGSLVVNPVPTEAGPIAMETCDLMRPLAAEKSQRLTCEVGRKLPLIVADAGRLQQVLSNLLGNAVKFVEPGGAIHLQVRAVEEGVRFSVFDNGPGIAAEDLPKIFDRHWRAHEKAHLGAGLGLAIAKGIVEAHGGRIWVESEPGSGTAFHFVIPLAGRSAKGRSDEQPAAPKTVGTAGEPLVAQ